MYIAGTYQETGPGVINVQKECVNTSKADTKPVSPEGEEDMVTQQGLIQGGDDEKIPDEMLGRKSNLSANNSVTAAGLLSGETSKSGAESCEGKGRIMNPVAEEGKEAEGEENITDESAVHRDKHQVADNNVV